MKGLKTGAGKCFISCNYSCTISCLVKILLVKLKYLYTQYAWLSINKKQNSNQNGKVENWWYFSKLLTITIASFNFFNCPVKSLRNLKLKFRSKFNHGFTNHGYLHCAVWKALYNFKIKRAQGARHNQFFFQNVQNNEIFEIFKMFKNNSWINVYYTKSKRL